MGPYRISDGSHIGYLGSLYFEYVLCHSQKAKIVLKQHSLWYEEYYHHLPLEALLRTSQGPRGVYTVSIIKRRVYNRALCTVNSPGFFPGGGSSWMSPACYDTYTQKSMANDFFHKQFSPLMEAHTTCTGQHQSIAARLTTTPGHTGYCLRTGYLQFLRLQFQSPGLLRYRHNLLKYFNNFTGNSPGTASNPLLPLPDRQQQSCSLYSRTCSVSRNSKPCSLSDGLCL